MGATLYNQSEMHNRMILLATTSAHCVYLSRAVLNRKNITCGICVLPDPVVRKLCQTSYHAGDGDRLHGGGDARHRGGDLRPLGGDGDGLLPHDGGGPPAPPVGCSMCLQAPAPPATTTA